MCEYSFPTRLAQTDELIVTHRFSTGTIRFAPVEEIDALESNPDKKNRLWARVQRLFWGRTTAASKPITTVWIPPGSRLRVRQLPLESTQAVLLTPLEELTFIELDMADHRYRDALRLRTGGILPLQYMEEGVQFQVISTESQEPEPYGPQLEVNQWLR